MTGPRRSTSKSRVWRAGFPASPGVVASSDSSEKSNPADRRQRPRSRPRDDLDARPLAAAVGPQRRGVDDDLGDLVRPGQAPLVEPVDDEAGHVVGEVAGRVGAGEQQQVEGQVFLVGRQPRQVFLGEHRRRQARQRVDPEPVSGIDHVDVLPQRLQRQRHCQRLQVGGYVERPVDGPEARGRHPKPVGAERRLEREGALCVRRGVHDRLRLQLDEAGGERTGLREQADEDAPHRPAGSRRRRRRRRGRSAAKAAERPPARPRRGQARRPVSTPPQRASSWSLSRQGRSTGTDRVPAERASGERCRSRPGRHYNEGVFRTGREPALRNGATSRRLASRKAEPPGGGFRATESGSISGAHDEAIVHRRSSVGRAGGRIDGPGAVRQRRLARLPDVRLAPRRSSTSCAGSPFSTASAGSRRSPSSRRRSGSTPTSRWPTGARRSATTTRCSARRPTTTTPGRC